LFKNKYFVAHALPGTMRATSLLALSVEQGWTGMAAPHDAAMTHGALRAG
jgi:hypothetical protein